MKLYRTNLTNNYTYLLVYPASSPEEQDKIYYIWESISPILDSGTRVVIDYLKTNPDVKDILAIFDAESEEESKQILDKYIDRSLQDKFHFTEQTFRDAQNVFKLYCEGELEEIPVEHLLTHPEKELREIARKVLHCYETL